MKKRTQQHHLDGLLVLLLFGVFASCILFVLLTGADTYRRLTDRDGAAYSCRTATQYITTKVRQSTSEDAVSIEPFENTEALVLRETVDGETYLTRIYCHDGYLKELFASADAELLPEDGEKILPIGALTFTLDRSLLSVDLSDTGGRDVSLTLALR